MAVGKDPRWSLVEAARPVLVRTFADRGVVRVEFTAAFPHFEAFAMWLCTVIDRRRDGLGVAGPCRRCGQSYAACVHLHPGRG